MFGKKQGKDAGRLQVLGLCRFSHLGEGAFRQMADATLEERRAALFDPRRLDLRMIWFRNVFLPAVAAQTNKDFHLCLLTSDALPEPWRSELVALTADVPQISIAYRPPGPHREVCNAVMHGLEDSNADVVAQFRLDDDDAIAVDFVDRVRSDFTLMAALQKRHRMLALDYGKGLVVRDMQDRVEVTCRITQSWAPGLVLFFPARNHRALMDFQHHRVASRMAFVGLIDSVMFVRGAHAFNDAGVSDMGATFAMPTTGPDALLRERFLIDRQTLETELRLYHGAQVA